MTEANSEKTARARDASQQERPEARVRIAELEAENAALRRALARASFMAESVGRLHAGELGRERAGRAADTAQAHGAVAEAEARHERAMAAGRADFAVSEVDNEGLRRANAALAESRATLREREERLRLILDSAADYAIFTTDLDRRVTSWNAGAARLLGWTEEEIVGHSADVIFTPEDRAGGAPEQEAGRAMAEGRAANERWHQRRDGSRFWASGLVMPLRDPAAGPNAPPLGLLKIMRDRTAEREAEQALRESEDHLRHMAELNPQIPWTADPLGRITGFSQRWLEVTGLTHEEALGEGWMQVPHPDDRGRMAVAWDHSVSTGAPYDVEARLRMADGRYRWWRARAFPRRDAEGRIVRWYGTTEDIHDRKLAEARLAALVELGDRLRDLHTAAGVAGAAAGIAGRTLGAVRAGFGALDADGEIIRIEHGWADGRAESEVGARRMAERWPGLAEAVWHGEVVVIVDVAGDPRTAGHAESYSGRDVRALLWVPVTEAGRVAAVLHVEATAPRRWTEEEVAFVHGVAERAWAATRRVRAEQRRKLLVNELNHRVKNTLAVVQALALYTARGTPDPAAFAAAFQARLRTLARAHDLLTREDWTGAAAGDVVRAALAPFAADSTRLDLSACVPGVVLPPGAALSLAMALHELATNALKYGALSVPEGRVSIACVTGPADGAPMIEWTERGGPPLAGPPARRGFGLRLLERGLAAQAGMQADLRFEPAGVRCTIRLPAPRPDAPAAER